MTEALFTTKIIELVGKKEFIATILNPKDEALLIHITSILSISLDLVHPFYKVQILFLKADKASIAILFKYTDFMDVFSPDLTTEFLEHTGINHYAIKVIKSKQLLYKLIYSLELVMLETLKTYIKTTLGKGFIRRFKSQVGAPIFLI